MERGAAKVLGPAEGEKIKQGVKVKRVGVQVTGERGLGGKR